MQRLSLSAGAHAMARQCVSVLIPAYNAESTIERTLASVTAQTHRNLEIIVIDDGSLDRTARLVGDWCKRDERVILLRKPNAGLAAARNTALQCSNGVLIAPIDADDLWHPTKIEKQLAVFSECTRNLGAVYCWSRAINTADCICFDLPTMDFHGDVLAPLVYWNFIHSGSLLFRRDLALEIGGYDETLAARGATTCEDLKFNLDLADCCDFDIVPEFLTGYRLNAGSMSTNTAAMRLSRSIVIGEIRSRHPELPSRLFRWASAVAARECSRVFLQRGEFSKALSLLTQAAIDDPAGALSFDVGRIVLGGVLVHLGLKKHCRDFLRARQPASGSANLIGSQPYFEADPRRFMEPRSSRWDAGRLSYLRGIRANRLYSAAGAGCERDAPRQEPGRPTWPGQAHSAA